MLLYMYLYVCFVLTWWYAYQLVLMALQIEVMLLHSQTAYDDLSFTIIKVNEHFWNLSTKLLGK